MVSRPSSKPVLIYTHRVGDRVSWNMALLSASQHHAQIGSLHGTGPFIILAVYPVPPANQRTVGHHQWLNVDGPYSEQTLSGAWFVPADKT